MLMMDENGYKYVAKLRAELAWLREHHPDKTALIGAAESWLKTVDDAGSVKSYQHPNGTFTMLIENMWGKK